MNEDQRAMVAGRLATMPQGGDRKSEKIKPQVCDLKSEAQAAQALNVKTRAVSAAKAVLRDGAAEVVKAVDRDKRGRFRFTWAARLGTMIDKSD